MPWLTVLLVLILLAAEATAAAVIPLSVRYLADRGIGAGDQKPLSLALSFLAAFVGLAIAAGILRDMLAPRCWSGYLTGLRQVMFERLQRLPLPGAVVSGAAPAPVPDSSAEAENGGQPPALPADRNEAVLERFSRDLALVEKSASLVFSSFALPALQALLVTAVIFWLRWEVGFAALVLWPWVLLAPRGAEASAARGRDALAAEEKNLLSLVKESLAAPMFIRAFSLESLRNAGFRKRNQTLSREALRAGRFPAFLRRVADAGTICILAGILALSGWIASSERAALTAGTMAAVQLLSLVLAYALTSMGGYLAVFSEGRAAQERISSALDSESDLPETAGGGKVLPSLHSEIGFSSVRFTYAPDREPKVWQIAGITARIPKGVYVAFAGPTGCGKSTLLRLLLRFYDPQEGTLSIDGHDLKSVSLASLRSRIGVVLQENYIFDASIRDNIRVARPDASEEAIAEAVRLSGLDEIVRGLPQSYDTMLGERGARLSPAGIQRIALSRALLRTPDVLVLDEATSALDPAEEVVIGDVLKSLRKGRTTIALTHRLSTVADADHIFVMDNGAIVEQGSHFELLAANGVYASYWRKQAGFTFSADGKHVDVDAARLQAFPILEKLDEATLARLAPFFVTETFPPGREIVRQNDSGDRFYIIARGRVEVWRTEEQTGNTSSIAILEAGDFFGEITLITGFPRTATVRSMTYCTCISLERGHFSRLLEHYPELQKEMSDIAIQRLRETSKAGLA